MEKGIGCTTQALVLGFCFDAFRLKSLFVTGSLQGLILPFRISLIQRVSGCPLCDALPVSLEYDGVLVLVRKEKFSLLFDDVKRKLNSFSMDLLGCEMPITATSPLL